MSRDLDSLVAVCVPLRIDELKRRGGPTEEHLRRARGYAHDLAERGDVLLFGGGKKGEAAELANELIDGIAVLAFVPGGVTLFGMHFEAS